MPVTVNQYVYGNSLFNYAEGGALTNVAVWMDYFAENAGNAYTIDGGYGFLRNFASRETPFDRWSFDGVTGAWDSENDGFADADFNSAILLPANFIQWQPVEAPYWDGNSTPLEAMVETITDFSSAHPGAPVMIFEGWADMGPMIDAFPPSAAELARYHDYNIGAYHDWYVDAVAKVNAADPDLDVKLLPVAQILSEIMTEVLPDVPASDLYVDDAPHGTETTYFLASMVVYNASYGTPVPAVDVPAVIHPAVADRFDQINALIDTRLSEAGFEDAPTAAPDTDAAPQEPAEEPSAEDTPEVAPEADAAVEDPPQAEPPQPEPPQPEPPQPEPMPVQPEPEAMQPEPEAPETPPAQEPETPEPEAPATPPKPIKFNVDLSANPLTVGGAPVLPDPVAAPPAPTEEQPPIEPPAAAPVEEPAPIFKPAPVEQPSPALSEPPAPKAAPPEPDTAPAPQPEPTAPPAAAPVAPEPATDAWTASYWHVADDVSNLNRMDWTDEAEGEVSVENLAYAEETEGFWEGARHYKFVARFEKDLVLEDTQTFAMTLVADDDARVYVDGEQVLGAQTDLALRSAEVTLGPGAHSLRVDYLENYGEATLQLNITEVETPEDTPTVDSVKLAALFLPKTAKSLEEAAEEQIQADWLAELYDQLVI